MNQAALYLTAVTVLAASPDNAEGQNAAPELLWEVGALDGADWEMWGRIIAVALSDTWVAVYDAHHGEIRIFDHSGSYQRTIGRAGEGPGEFAGPVLISLAGDSLNSIMPMAGGRASHSVSDGTLLGSGSMPLVAGSRFGLVDQRTIGPTVWGQSGMSGGSSGMAAYLYRWNDRAGPEAVDTVIEMHHLSSTYVDSRGDRHMHPLSAGADRTIDFVDDSTLIVLDAIEGVLTGLRVGEVTLDTLWQSQLPARGGPPSRQLAQRYRDQAGEEDLKFFRNEFEPPEEVAAWLMVLPDGAGSVWVQRFGLRGDAEEWIRVPMGPGAPTGEWSPPERAVLKAVHGDRAITVRRGDFDEEYLQLWHLGGDG